jgi:hypothetical protein
MPRLNNKFKKGATSIYVVVLGTLLFSVITVSFIRIIVSETAKTTSDELAQSAYDSALAGIEDAKTALKRYYECKMITDEANRPEDCDTIVGNIEDGFTKANLSPSDADYGYCDAVTKALSRNDAEGGEVLVQEQSSNNDSGRIVQAYTCLIIDNELEDYRGTLYPDNPVYVVPLKTEHPETVTGVRIQWTSEGDGAAFSSLSYLNKNAFYPTDEGTAVPPTISAQIIQTANSFNLDQFTSSSGKSTNRGTVILVPSGEDQTVVTGTSQPAPADAITHIGRLSNGTTILADSNNHSYSRTTTNEPQKIKCRTKLSDEFACVASIEIPGPVGGADADGYATERNRNTFLLVLTLPYATPTTSFAVQLCTDKDTASRGDCLENDNTSIALFKDAQVSVDATGRANDMYTRVEARVEFRDNFPYAEFALQATGTDDEAIKKNFYVTSNCINTDDPNNPTTCDDTGDIKD